MTETDIYASQQCRKRDFDFGVMFYSSLYIIEALVITAINRKKMKYYAYHIILLFLYPTPQACDKLSASGKPFVVLEYPTILNMLVSV